MFKYSCACGKEYKFRQSLHVHKKTCNKTSVLVDNYSENTNGMNENNLIIDLLTELKLEREQHQEQHQEQQSELLRRNEEQQNQLMDLQKQIIEAIQKGNTV